MKKKKSINIILLVIWMIFIFIMSSFVGNDSSEQSNFIVNIIVEIFNIKNISLISLIVRKTAHVTEFLILSILFTNVIKLYDKKLFLGIIYSFLYAISDEIHQIFVPGRACQITDMLIDLFGIIIGFLIYIFINDKLKRKE